MLEKIKATIRLRKCALCGAEKETPAKPEPKNAKEKKEIAWRCNCGAVMLRDGTSIYRKGLPPEAGADDPDPAKPKPGTVKLQPPEAKSPGTGVALFSVLAALAGFAVMVSRRKKANPAEPVTTKSPQEPGKPEVNYLGPVR